MAPSESGPKGPGNDRPADPPRRRSDDLGGRLSGHMTQREADVAASFFAAPQEQSWPANPIQRRMQNSGR